jgi:hypothetical protein
MAKRRENTVAAVEIAKKDWDRFLEEFSHRHQGWLVEVQPVPSGEMQNLQALPLEAMSRHVNGEEEAFVIFVQNQDLPHGHLVRSIPEPSRLEVEDRGGGDEKTLRVTSANGSTVVRLQRVIRPPTNVQRSTARP